MEWLYVKPLDSDEQVKKFEKKYNVNFPSEFTDFIVKHNGARPDPYLIDAEKKKEIPAKGFLSFNLMDKPEDIWSTYDTLKSKLPVNIIPFMGDEGGNYFCIDLDPLEEIRRIVYWEHEMGTIQLVANGFQGFLEKFYDFD